jgi:hypothetical protein
VVEVFTAPHAKFQFSMSLNKTKKRGLKRCFLRYRDERIGSAFDSGQCLF